MKQRYILGICVLIGCACVKMLFHPPPLHRQRFGVYVAKAGDKQHSGGPGNWHLWLGEGGGGEL